ncbi:hypothetical protein OESDEN_06428 [Oesophagostomum dentatum]|uniref:Uncharacterized protein n=1 Tax=Oesophagostomum dentatum TaxID=61180 RepID=A0A0B1T8X2_OESDE|nr:hypothetical protein OESDEN_06428 [Oesophagostomum dentatum]
MYSMSGSELNEERSLIGASSKTLIKTEENPISGTRETRSEDENIELVEPDIYVENENPDLYPIVNENWDPIKVLVLERDWGNLPRTSKPRPGERARVQNDYVNDDEFWKSASSPDSAMKGTEIKIITV